MEARLGKSPLEDLAQGAPQSRRSWLPSPGGPEKEERRGKRKTLGSVDRLRMGAPEQLRVPQWGSWQACVVGGLLGVHCWGLAEKPEGTPLYTSFKQGYLANTATLEGKKFGTKIEKEETIFLLLADNMFMFT